MVNLQKHVLHDSDNRWYYSAWYVLYPLLGLVVGCLLFSELSREVELSCNASNSAQDLLNTGVESGCIMHES